MYKQQALTTVTSDSYLLCVVVVVVVVGVVASEHRVRRCIWTEEKTLVNATRPLFHFCQQVFLVHDRVHV